MSPAPTSTPTTTASAPAAAGCQKTTSFLWRRRPSSGLAAALPRLLGLLRRGRELFAFFTRARAGARKAGFERGHEIDDLAALFDLRLGDDLLAFGLPLDDPEQLLALLVVVLRR